MPKSTPPRSKASTRRGQNAIQDMIQKASALDRRRQAQIANQVASINRLLETISTHRCGHELVDEATGHPLTPRPMQGYTEEMKILHEGAAALMAENDELRQLMRELVQSLDALPLDGLRLGRSAGVTRFAEALAVARAAAGLNPLTGEALSAPVSESGGEAG